MSGTEDDEVARAARRTRALRARRARLTPADLAAQHERRARRAAATPEEAAAREARRARRAAIEAPTMPAPDSPDARDMTLVPIYADEDIAIGRVGDPAAETVVLCFAGIGAHDAQDLRPGIGMGGIQPAEFLRTSLMQGSFVLHIADIQRSWFNGFDHQRLLAVLEPILAGKRVITLGNSMGGFGAIWISTLLPVDVVIAFVPQFSVHPDIVPRERRWLDWRARITDWKVPSLADCFVPGTRYYTFNGDRDREHWRQFVPMPNAHHYLIAGAHHHAAVRMKNAGVLQGTINACIAGSDPKRVIEGGGLTVSEL